MPKIVDQFQVYLRELRASDMQGMDSIYRLREALLTRANAETSPIKIHDVLFRDILIQ
jgi:flagellar FliL protein